MVTHSIEEAVYMSDRAVVLSRDPARVIADITISLPHWRDKLDLRFTKLKDEIYSILTHREIKTPTVSGDQKKNLQALPGVPSGALTGFIELLEDLGLKADLYKLADQLSLDLEDFLPIVEATRLLQFAVVQQGDIELTPIGRNFAEATVIERKDIFKKQLLDHIPIIEKIVWILQSKSNRKMPRDFFLEIFNKQFSEQEAERQLDLTIEWGRYAEVFAYDEVSKQLFLELEQVETQE
jgi:NitT/TauT family transport system ATP-binding protein